MASPAEKTRDREQAAARRRAHRSLGLCACGRPCRGDGTKTCEVCYTRACLRRQPLQERVAARQPVSYVRVSWGVTHSHLAAVTAFCDRHNMTLETFLTEATECYMEVAEAEEARDRAQFQAELATIVYEDFYATG